MARETTVAIVGAGPNGLAAGIVLARAGHPVMVYDAAQRVGGSVSSAELTLPGFVHDICSSVFPLGAGSPYLSSLPLASHGAQWRHPPIPFAHPLDDGSVACYGSIDETARQLGDDGKAYVRLMAPLVRGWSRVSEDVLAPLRLPQHPLALAAFGVRGVWPATLLARRLFRGERARALFAGAAAHANAPLDRPLTSAFALLLGAAAHAVGWPFVAGGAQRLADALAGCVRDAGGTLHTGQHVAAIDELSPSSIVMCDVMPAALAQIAPRLPTRFRHALTQYRHGPGAFKVDWALDGPVPWKDEVCRLAGTLHLGGTLAEIAGAEAAVASGQHPDRPFVLFAQPSVCDPERAPAGRHVAWGYCHVPSGSAVDMTDRIERQVERFAPGFRDRILARHVMSPSALEAHNPNLRGGDVGGGAMTVGQILARPTWRTYRTPDPRLYLCSAATPPGGGVHGMCGYHAAMAVLSDLATRG